jgi:hypothetical protein
MGRKITNSQAQKSPAGFSYSSFLTVCLASAQEQAAGRED